MKSISAMMRWLRIGGIYVRDDDSRVLLAVKRVVSTILMQETIVSMILYLYTEDRDLFDVSATLYSLFMFVGMWSQYTIFVRRSPDVRRLIDDVTAWAQQQCQLNGHELFEAVERRVNRDFRIFESFTIFSAAVYVAVPALSQYLAYRGGRVTSETYASSFHDAYYFFETTETPLYHIFYAAFALGVGAMMMSYLAKGFLFIALCFYFVALYDDLKWMLVRIDRQPCVTARRRLTGQCVRVHNQIYRFLERANDILSVAIFIQLSYSLSTLTMCVFSITFLDTTDMLVPLINSGCLVGELFLFCWTGSMVLDEADKVNLCVYNLNWFEYTVAEQRSLLMILQRNHRPIGLSAANYFSCNLVTFHWIITKVFSAFTFLQSME